MVCSRARHSSPRKRTARKSDGEAARRQRAAADGELCRGGPKRANRWRPTRLLAAASLAAGRCEMDSGRGRARPGLRRRGRGGGRGKERLGPRNRREARPGTDRAAAARLCSARVLAREEEKEGNAAEGIRPRARPRIRTHAERRSRACGARMAGGGDACGAPSRTERRRRGEADRWAQARKKNKSSLKFEMKVFLG